MTDYVLKGRPTMRFKIACAVLLVAALAGTGCATKVQRHELAMQPEIEVTASTRSNAPSRCTISEIASIGWRMPVLVSAWTIITTFT